MALLFVAVALGILTIAAGAVWTGSLSADHVAAFASVMTLILTLGGVVIAAAALETWRSQVRGAARLEIAIEVADAVGTLKVEFQNHRAPLIETGEYPNGNPPAANLPEMALRSQYEFVFANRYNEFKKHIYRVHTLRGKVLTVLDAKCANSLVELAREARGLEAVFRMYCVLRAQSETGRNVLADLRRYESQALVAQDGEPTDELSARFNQKFSAVLTCLEPYLGLRSR